MGWIGVDLDGTLAHCEGWIGPENIGAPIAPMVRRVQEWIARGQEVRIFTARAQHGEEMVKRIQGWCEKHIGMALPVTNVKDYACLELWDDRAVRVMHNTGQVCCARPTWSH